MRDKPKLAKIAIATIVERAASFQKLGRTKLTYTTEKRKVAKVTKILWEEDPCP